VVQLVAQEVALQPAVEGHLDRTQPRTGADDLHHLHPIRRDHSDAVTAPDTDGSEPTRDVVHGLVQLRVRDVSIARALNEREIGMLLSPLPQEASYSLIHGHLSGGSGP
jgi:hypothetical protein